MRKKRIMVVGPSGCGKTSLVNCLNDFDGQLKKTQNIIYAKNTMDVPGSYIEIPWMYKHLIAASQDASHVVLLLDQSRRNDVYSPGFAKSFRCPVIGVVTKTDLMPENADSCLRQLKMIGINEPYYWISVIKNEGIKSLKDYLLTESIEG